MAKRTAGTGYWLSVVDTLPGHKVLEAEPGFKRCKRPGYYHVWQGPEGPVCPGCERQCRIVAMANCQHGDPIRVLGANQ
ncbi:MAG TPA: hypothetical protein PKC79_02190 [Solidesulfovibrio magneticus]|nr:hypothetical protein [Solidesulfovibrio magneticus]